MTETLCKFGHHPDPANDFCIEVEAVEGMLADAKAGLVPLANVRARVADAMRFRVGGDVIAVKAKDILRRIEIEACND